MDKVHKTSIHDKVGMHTGLYFIFYCSDKYNDELQGTLRAVVWEGDYAQSTILQPRTVLTRIPISKMNRHKHEHDSTSRDSNWLSRWTMNSSPESSVRTHIATRSSRSQHR